MASFFENMLRAVLDAPEDPAMDQLRAQTVLDGAGSDAVEEAIRGGDPHASALYCMALGETRASLKARIETPPTLN